MRRPQQRPFGALHSGRTAGAGRALTAGVAVALATGCSGSDAGADVLLDGLFGEWAEASTVIDDPPDAPGAAVDVLSVQALDDEHWLYLALDVGNEVALQALPGTLQLMLDADGDTGTGALQHGMNGVDVIVDFSQAPSPLAADRRAGFGVRAGGGGDAMSEVARDAMGLVAAPTWAAPRFELRVSRSGVGGAPPLERAARLKLVYLEDGQVLEETGVGSYAFETRVAEPGSHPREALDVEARLSRPPGSVRVAAWNVAVGSFTARHEGFARVLSALAPDVVLLDELPPDISAARLESFFSAGPLGELGAWTVTLGESGGVQRAAVAARDHPSVPAITSVPYPDGSLEALEDVGPVGNPDGWHEHLDAERERGVSAAGAWVEIDGRRVLFTAVDLQSGGWAASPRDRLRAVQAGALRSRLVEVMEGRPAPVVVGGDLNLVGSRTPLFTLARRLDVDGSDLVTVDAERLGERTLTTWRNSRDVFAPGRLDFLLVPDAAVAVANSFVFATEDLADPVLERLGLERDLMENLSDHLVVVADVIFAPGAP